MNADSLQSRVVEQVAEDYRRRGYDVEVAPLGAQLPEFLGGYQPGLIARGPGESVVVEVKVGTRTSAFERYQEVAERVDRQPGWRFSLVYVNPGLPDEISEAQPASLPTLHARVRDADDVLRLGKPEAAFLLLFSAIEGILRYRGRRAHLALENLPSSTLIRELYSAGEIDREQLESLLRFLPARNQLTHGFRSEQAPNVDQLRALAQALLEETESGEDDNG